MAFETRIYQEPDDQGTWDELVASSPHGHVLQGWAWGELKAQFGWRVARMSAGSAAAQVLYRTLPLGLGSIAYVPKGPLVDFHDQLGFDALLDAIQPLAREQGAICLKIEPNEPDDAALVERLEAAGFVSSPQTVQPRRTILVDLNAEPDDVLKRMKQKTRYNVRLAGRKGVTVRPGDESDLPAFYELMALTAERDDFAIHSQPYYELAHQLFVPAGQGQLLLAEHGGQLLAGLVVMALGDTACYMYGASSNEGRNLMPTYLLQWEAMLWAKKQGYTRYDLWGVPDEDQETLEASFQERSDGLWGVYRFKRGFGGQLIRTAGAWDMVYAPLRYRIYEAIVNWLNRRRAE
jgi:lipid II:glycine glycyltransferase (peptidoglycan interpeptide bridge formation enzyme)